MKTQLLTIAIGILTVGGIAAKPAATITFGAPHQKVFPADANSPRRVCIELPVKITNTSTEPISFGTNGGPQFNEYLQRRANSKHWSDITVRGMCGMGWSMHTLAPGESHDSTMWLQQEYGGHGYRLSLGISRPNSNGKNWAKIKSDAIVLPKIKG